MTEIQRIIQANNTYFGLATSTNGSVDGQPVLVDNEPVYKDVIIKEIETNKITIVEYRPEIANYLNELDFQIEKNSDISLNEIYPITKDSIQVEMTFFPNEDNELKFIINIDKNDLLEIYGYEWQEFENE